MTWPQTVDVHVDSEQIQVKLNINDSLGFWKGTKHQDTSPWGAAALAFHLQHMEKTMCLFYSHTNSNAQACQYAWHSLAFLAHGWAKMITDRPPAGVVGNPKPRLVQLYHVSQLFFPPALPKTDSPAKTSAWLVMMQEKIQAANKLLALSDI